MPNARHEFCDSVGQWVLFATKSQLSSYAAQENFNIPMNIGGIERTRVPLES